MVDLRTVALALLNADPATVRLSRRAGSFLGQCVADPLPLTDKQAEWLASLLNRAGLSALNSGGEA